MGMVRHILIRLYLTLQIPVDPAPVTRGGGDNRCFVPAMFAVSVFLTAVSTRDFVCLFALLFLVAQATQINPVMGVFIHFEPEKVCHGRAELPEERRRGRLF